MYIEIHGFVVVVRDMKEKNINFLCDKILKVNIDSFRKSSFGNIVNLSRAFGDVKESVHIKYNANSGYGYTSINLHGSFFDCAPDFKLSKLINYLSKFEYTPKQLDIAFNDDEKQIRKKDVIRWCRYPKDYCMGSLVSKRAPEIVYCERKLSRIHLASPRSKSNFGTIYFRPNTGCLRVEIKFKDVTKIQYILEDYSNDNIIQFETRSLDSLVGCIDFITATSRKSRVPEKYQRQPQWESFLGSDPRKINWRKLKEAKHANRATSDKEDFDKTASRLGSTIGNMVDRFKGIHTTDKILKELSEFSGVELGNVCKK